MHTLSSSLMWCARVPSECGLSVWAAVRCRMHSSGQFAVGVSIRWLHAILVSACSARAGSCFCSVVVCSPLLLCCLALVMRSTCQSVLPLLHQRCRRCAGRTIPYQSASAFFVHHSSHMHAAEHMRICMMMSAKQLQSMRRDSKLELSAER